MSNAKIKLTKVVKETRRSQFKRGLKSGAVKGTINNTLELVTGPLCDRLMPKLQAIHPMFKVADPAVRALVNFSVLVTLAEILEMSAGIASKIPGLNMPYEEAERKMSAIAAYIRTYSAEHIGEQTVEALVDLVPAIKEMLTGSDISELLNAVSADAKQSVSEHAFSRETV